MLYDKRWNKTVAPVKVKIEPWRRLLLKAARILERDGWCKGNFYWRTRSCALGAINRAAYGRPYGARDGKLDRPDVTEAIHQLRLFVVTPAMPAIESWNDTAGRTGAEVIATMRKVAGA